MEGLLMERMALEGVRRGEICGVGETPRGENFELYQMVNDGNKAVATLESLNGVLKAKNKETEQEISHLKSSLKEQQTIVKTITQELSNWEVK